MTRRRVTTTALTLAMALFLGACSGGGNGGGGGGPSPTTTRGGETVGTEFESPYLTSAQVSEATGIEMHATLASQTDCEWLAVDDTAISASLTTLTAAEVAQHSDETPVPGIGDEAYVNEGLVPTLWLRTGDSGFEVSAVDLNGTGRLDEKAAVRALARLLAAG